MQGVGQGRYAVHFDLTVRESRPLPLDAWERASKLIVNQQARFYTDLSGFS